MIDLKPCPFCGGVAHLDFAHGSNQTFADKNGFKASTPILYMVFCENCFSRTVPCVDTEIATVIWNRRNESAT